MSTPCSTPSNTASLAEALSAGLRAELDLTPKPGLVDRRDSGSHDDLDYPLMLRSIALLEQYFSGCVNALHAGHGIERLRELGLLAEQRMFARLGTNTHRGAIFLGGLLLGAAHAADCNEPRAVSDAVTDCAHQLFAQQLPRGTTGERVRARYRVGGIVGEALNGLPAVFTVGVPALHEARRRGLNERDGLYLAMARLMQTVEDTTALRRCGPDGLARLRRDGARLERLLEDGNDPIPFLEHCNRQYRTQRLTMGGVADLLAICVAWVRLRDSGQSSISDYTSLI